MATDDNEGNTKQGHFEFEWEGSESPPEENAMVYIHSPSNSPQFNLALEQYVFDEMDTRKRYFLLWQNDKTIVVGRHQNTPAEVNIPYVEQHGLHVVRRLSGGGAVYHDMGNLCFTFIMDAEEGGALDFSFFCRPVVRALARLGVQAEISGRNDITIAGKKFSGNSQYLKRGRVMHHGTILWNSDLSVVGKALRVPPGKMRAKGVKSVQSRVTNVCEHLPSPLPLQAMQRALLDEIQHSEAVTPYSLSAQDIRAVETIENGRYATWEWNWGRSPAYNTVKQRRVEGCGEICLHLDVDKGRIRDLKAFGDFFGSGEISELAQTLKGCPLQRRPLADALAEQNIDSYFRNLDVSTFIDLLVG